MEDWFNFAKDLFKNFNLFEPNFKRIIFLKNRNDFSSTWFIWFRLKSNEIINNNKKINSFIAIRNKFNVEFVIYKFFNAFIYKRIRFIIKYIRIIKNQFFFTWGSSSLWVIYSWLKSQFKIKLLNKNYWYSKKYIKQYKKFISCLIW